MSDSVGAAMVDDIAVALLDKDYGLWGLENGRFDNRLKQRPHTSFACKMPAASKKACATGPSGSDCMSGLALLMPWEITAVNGTRPITSASASVSGRHLAER